MNDRITKWTWDKFAVPEPEFDWRSIATPIERPALVEDPAPIRQLVDFPDAELIDVLFYPNMGRALIVVHGCEVVLSLDELRQINKSCPWDVMVVTHSEFQNAINTALRKFAAIENIPTELPQTLIENGIMDLNDLSIADPDWLASCDGMTIESADKLIEYADENAAP